MNQQKTVESRVLSILKDCPRARFDDMILVMHYYNRYATYLRAGELPLNDLAFNYKSYGLPCFETIRRARQRVQSLFPEYSRSANPDDDSNAALGKRGTVWNGCVYISPSLWQGYKNFKEVYCLWTSMPKPDESGRRKPMQKLNMVDADTLLYQPLDKPRFVVDGLIPTGLVLFCGSQKIGKSWLMLKLCLHLQKRD